MSLNRDNTHSCVRISHGSNKFVMNLNNNKTEIPEDQEQLFISELFKDIQDAILLILHYRTMLLFRATSSTIFTILDVRSFSILSSTLD